MVHGIINKDIFEKLLLPIIQVTSHTRTYACLEIEESLRSYPYNIYIQCILEGEISYTVYL